MESRKGNKRKEEGRKAQRRGGKRIKARRKGNIRKERRREGGRACRIIWWERFGMVATLGAQRGRFCLNEERPRKKIYK